jgi:hypothetical protein
MVLYPPQILGGTLPGCVQPEIEQDAYVPLAYQAYRLKLTFNSGYFARIDEDKGQQYCRELHEQIRAGQFADDTIYVVHPQYREFVVPHIPRIVCGQLHGYMACVSSAADTADNAFRDFLQQQKLE